MGNFDTEFIALLLNEEKAIEEDSLILQDIYINRRELSISTSNRMASSANNNKFDEW